LETAHSIFKPWRSQVRSDALFSTINYVLSRFVKPFLQLLRHTSTLLLSTSVSQTAQQRQLTAQSARLLVEIFYDLTCQDLPPDIEDAHQEFWDPQGGVFLAYLAWNPTDLRGDVSPPTLVIMSILY
jgi:exportin-2 (importin alpha re-exporter)